MSISPACGVIMHQCLKIDLHQQLLKILAANYHLHLKNHQVKPLDWKVYDLLHLSKLNYTFLIAEQKNEIISSWSNHVSHEFNMEFLRILSLSFRKA